MLTPEEKRARRNAYCRELYQRNLERNRAEGRERAKAYRERNPEVAAVACAKWREKNPEKVLAYRAEYGEENRELLAAKARAAYRRDPEKMIARSQAYAEKHPSYSAANSRRRREADPARAMWMASKRAAKDKGILFNIEPSDVIIPTHCPVFGLKLERGKSQAHDASPSIDRIIPALGYTKGNIIVVSYLANTLKNRATVPQMQRLAEFYTALRPIGCPIG